MWLELRVARPPPNWLVHDAAMHSITKLTLQFRAFSDFQDVQSTHRKNINKLHFHLFIVIKNVESRSVWDIFLQIGKYFILWLLLSLLNKTMEHGPTAVSMIPRWLSSHSSNCCRVLVNLGRNPIPDCSSTTEWGCFCLSMELCKDNGALCLFRNTGD